MSLQNPALQSLRDIHLPAPISIWPLAPGWYVLMIILIVGLIWLSIKFYQNYQRSVIKKLALTQLKDLHLAYQQQIQTPQQIAAAISILLRRVALAYFRREEIAGLHGRQWLNFLNASGNTNEFTATIGNALITAPYQKQFSGSLESLFQLSQQWVRQRV